VGRFEVLRPLGEGGMGLTFLAYDPQLEREVCLKVLKPLVSDDEGAEHQRLLWEARAQAQLSHPAIVPVYEVVADAEAVALVMEYVRDGRSLREWLQRPRTASQVLEVVLQAGEGLSAAHATGVVHRDFKPDNVMLAKGRARIIDFGLARRVVDLGPGAAPTSENPTLTVAAGSPAYMAPELFSGAAGDARADQYSFCVTLYEALTGTRPFARPRLRDQLRAQLEFQLAPHERIPAGVLQVLRRGLDPDPRQRFGSMAALLSALGEVSPKKPRRLALVLGASLGLLGGAGLLWALTSLTSRPSLTSGAAVAQVPAAPRTVAAQIAPASPVPVPPAPLMVAERPRPSTVEPQRAEPVSTAPRRGGDPVAQGHRPSMASVDIECSHPATVLWKGRVIGRAPGRVALPPGPQEVELVSLQLHARRRLQVKAPGSARLVFEQGELEVLVSPWANVMIDGQPLGPSPVPVQTLWEGTHTVVFERPEPRYRAAVEVTVAPRRRELVRHRVP